MNRIVARLVRPNLPIRSEAKVGDVVKVREEEYATYGPAGTTHLSYIRTEAPERRPKSTKVTGPSETK